MVETSCLELGIQPPLLSYIQLSKPYHERIEITIMWLLSCDGKLFGGKTKWLPPDSQHVLGRTTGKKDDGTREPRVHWIENKTVSRKHFVIKVGSVKQDASSHLHAKTEIEVIDNSKMGTSVNGEKIKGNTLKLTENVNTIRLGNYESTFKIRWQPVNLSISGVGKKKQKVEKLNDYRQKLVHTDIKITAEYLTQRTTHMISPKRNTPGCLQALVEARWIVMEGFVDALAAATVRDGGSNDGFGESKLEMDFEGNWPDEASFPIPISNEPVQRPAELCRPSEDRQGVFRDHIVVFTSQQRYDDLSPVINSGEGKAMIFDAEAEGWNVDAFVSHIKDAAGQKGGGPMNRSQYAGSGSIIVVSSGQDEFDEKLAIALHQRVIAANEFLDPILTLNTNPLHELLQYDSNSAPPSHQPTRSASRPRSQRAVRELTPARGTPALGDHDSRSQLAQEEQPARPPASSPRKRRIITQSRFKDFDSYDPTSFTKAPSDSPEPAHSEGKSPEQDNTGGEATDVDRPVEVLATRQSARKRPLEEIPEGIDTTESYLTGAQALKKRRLEAAQRGEKSGWEKPTESTAPTPATATTVAKKKTKEIDVRKELAARRAREEEARLKDEELEEQLKGVDISGMRDVAKIEEMEVPERRHPARAARNDPNSERWDTKWNGRKNFKKFRPQGQRADAPRLQRVIVTLEEVPRKGHGIGEEYWLTTSNSSLNSKSHRKSQPHMSQSMHQQDPAPTSEDAEEAARFRRRVQTSFEEDTDSALIDEVMPDATAGTCRDSGAVSQTQGPETQRAGAKRSAAQHGGPAAKKARPWKAAAPAVREVVDLDEDDGDELKFRRRRRV